VKQCLALAGCACLLAAGCVSTNTMARSRNGQPTHVTTSQRASRPTITRDFRPPGVDVQQASYNASCDECPSCGCAGDTCECGTACGAGCDGCGGACRGLVDGVACGFCGQDCCLCPNAGGYPEYPAFNQGPPVGQVAYPYYTTRGPRDFLMDNPPHIGPY
jgi:hypothetical protein